MSATEELRAMLDERGVEWDASDTYRWLVTSWKDASGHGWTFMEHRDYSFSKLTAYHLTPEQAIAATLGTGTCRYVLKDGWYGCSNCGRSMRAFEGKGDPLYPPNYCPKCGAKVVDE